MSKINCMYMHGLGDGLKYGESLILDYVHRRNGINVSAVDIDWASQETFEQLLERVTNQAGDKLDSISKYDLLLLEGSSAGGSLAFNVANQLDDKRVRVISHSGRLLIGGYKPGSFSSLERCAHLGTERASQSFYDSVSFCTEVTLPKLDEDLKSRMLITKPWADEVVPVSTMVVDGISSVTVPIVGHSAGIGLAMIQTPKLAKQHL